MSPDRAPLGKPARALLLGAFFLSGAAALAYEVVWSRALLLVLGSTATASAVVLGTFVGSLGLGARWGGRAAERSPRPLLLYGSFEVGAALWALLGPALVGLLEGPYVGLAAAVPGWVQTVLRLLVAVVVVAPAAFLLGATLPAMVRHWVRRSGETGRQTAWLYGVNTVGAVAGCLFTGYLGVERFGVEGMVRVAAALGAAIGLLAVLFGRAPWRVTAQPARAESTLGGGPRTATALASRIALLCGFIGLATEVVGFRVLVFFVEGFTVTFASMLGVFIAGLGLGSLVLGPVLARTRRPARTLGLLLMLQAAALLLGLLLVVPTLETWMRTIRDVTYAGARGPADIAAALRLSSLLGAGLLLFVPALLMGPTFPLCVRWAELGGDPPGEAVGRTYVWNSVGSLLAPILVTIAVIPLFHVTGAWVIVTFLAAASGLNLWWLRRWRAGPLGTIRLAALLGLGLGVGVLLLDLPGTRAEDLVSSSVVLRGRPGRSLLLVESDAVTTASVVDTAQGERYLYTDDFAAAATGRHYRYMRLLGHLPAVLAHRPRHAMVIAFGTGTTAGAVAQHEEVERLEVVEVSSAVLDLATYFADANRGVLDDERVRVIRDDGRNALLLHEPDLDVITLEPLMPYSPQGYPFYTREFYELARDRLREGGVLCQWVPVHAMPVGLYAAFVRAFFEVFPDGSLWFFEQSTALVGRKGSLEPDSTTMLGRITAIHDDLREAGFEEPWLMKTGYVAQGRDVLRLPPPPDFARYAGRPVVDMDPFPEFQPTPRAPLNTPYLHQTMQYLFSLVRTEEPEVRRAEWPGTEMQQATQLALAARWKEAEADYLGVAMRGMPLGHPQYAEREALRIRALEDAARGYRNALERQGGNRVLRWRLVGTWRRLAATRVLGLLARAKAARAAGREADRKEALVLAESIARAALPPALVDPDPVATRRIDAAALHAAVLLRLGRCQRAERTLREALEALQDRRRTGPLRTLLEGVAAHREGRAFTPAPEHAYVFEGAAPCREEGIAPVREAFDLFLAPGSPPTDLRVRRSQAKALVADAKREGVEEAVVAAVCEAPPSGVPSLDVLRAVVARQLDPADAALGALLESEDPLVRRLALTESGWWGLLRHYPQAMDAAASDDDVEIRRALAAAAAKHGHVEVLRRVVELLMDPDASVRAEAATVFWTHRPDLVEAFDPNGPQAERRALYEKVKASLGR